LGGTAGDHEAAVTEDTTIKFNSRFLGTANDLAVDLAHEGTHVMQNKIADSFKRNWSSLISCWSCLASTKQSYSGLMRIETEAYTNQGYMEEQLQMKGQIFDPDDQSPKKREIRIDTSARQSVNSPDECGSGSVGEKDSKCTE
jgi:hypothetical protein